MMWSPAVGEVLPPPSTMVRAPAVPSGGVIVALTVNVSSPWPSSSFATSTSLNVMPRRNVVITGLLSVPVLSVRSPARPRPETLVVGTMLLVIGSRSLVASISPMSS